MGYVGSQRTTRRAVAAARRAWRAGNGRVYKPWITEPGRWLQFDWGAGPVIDGRATQLFCAWLAWSRYRVVIPVWDKTLGTVLTCLDATVRRLGGAPTYVLTDNERTVTVDRIAGVAVRHPELVRAGRHYGSVLVAHPGQRGGRRSRGPPARRLPSRPRRRQQDHTGGDLLGIASDRGYNHFTHDDTARLINRRTHGPQFAKLLLVDAPRLDRPFRQPRGHRAS